MTKVFFKKKAPKAQEEFYVTHAFRLKETICSQEKTRQKQAVYQTACYVLHCDFSSAYHYKDSHNQLPGKFGETLIYAEDLFHTFLIQNSIFVRKFTLLEF